MFPRSPQPFFSPSPGPWPLAQGQTGRPARCPRPPPRGLGAWARLGLKSQVLDTVPGAPLQGRADQVPIQLTEHTAQPHQVQLVCILPWAGCSLPPATQLAFVQLLENSRLDSKLSAQRTHLTLPEPLGDKCHYTHLIDEELRPQLEITQLARGRTAAQPQGPLPTQDSRPCFCCPVPPGSYLAVKSFSLKFSIKEAVNFTVKDGKKMCFVGVSLIAPRALVLGLSEPPGDLSRLCLYALPSAGLDPLRLAFDPGLQPRDGK